MKLADHSSNRWCFQLNHQEANLLRGLLSKFPLSPVAGHPFSKSDDSAGAADRQKLLNESLAEHRRDLKRLARDLLREEHWRPSPQGPLLLLSSEAREILLQILNDIRLGCWQALGEPDDLEQLAPAEPLTSHRTLMDLAGYFEMNLLDPDVLC
jgi:hypothetical protein